MESSGPRSSAPRRSATAPVGFPPPQASSATQGGVETLYNHPNAKIIAFTATARAVPRSPSLREAAADEDQGTLSWSSQLERTLAVGTFRIYRAPGSVAFLNCGSALQPILPRSQCWCIEEDSSKFVLQIRKPQYWRIELPVADPEDAQRAVFLREILDKILLFEKTRCPFKRSFTVKLPEPPEPPVQKRPWTPRKSLVGPLPAEAPERSPTPTSSRSFSSSPLSARQSPSAGKSERTALDGDGVRLKATEDGMSKGTAGQGGKPDTSEPSTTTEARAQGNEPDGGRGNRRESAGTLRTSEASKLDREVDQSDDTGRHDDPQESSARVETPVKVKEVVSVIEERITEDPTPLTAVNDAITQAQQAAAMSPTISPASKSKSPGSRNTTPRSAATSTPTRTTPTVEPNVSPGRPMSKTVGDGRASVASEPESESGGSIRAAATTRTVTATPAGAKVSPGVPTFQPVDYGRPSVASKPERTGQGSMGTETAATMVTTPPVIPNVSPSVPASKSVCYGRPSVTTGPEREEREPAVDPPSHSTLPVPEDGPAEERVEEVTLSSDVIVDEVHEGAGQGANILRKRKLRRYGGFSTGRSSTMPPHLTVVTSPPEQPNRKPDPTVHARSGTPNTDSEKSGPASPTDSSDSFHSARSPVTPPEPAGADPPGLDGSPQTFPYPHDDIFLPDHASHHRDISDLTVTPDTRCTWDAMSMSSGASQFSAMTAPDQSLAPVEECRKSNASEDGACSSAVSRPAIRHRSTASISTNRALSPLPPAATLFNPKPRAVRRPSTRMEVLKRAPMTIVSKTCEILLGPPAYLVRIMLRVAARIVAGEWRGAVMGFGDDGERIPVQWDCEELSESEIDEMDFVMPEEEECVERFGGGGEDEAGRAWGVD